MFIRSEFFAVLLRRVRVGIGLVPAVLLLAAAPTAVAAPPTATINGPSSTTVNTPVTFTDSGDTTGVTHYLWDFGDGSTDDTTSNGSSHSYSTVGTYTVTLRVVDGSGETSSPSSQQISVMGAKPTAAFNPTEATVLAGSVVAFDGTQSSDPNPGGSITGYSWNFDDGTGSSAAQPNHSYTMPGTYHVSLKVTDNSGNTNSVTHKITVIAPPPIQTLVESVIPAPILVKFGSPSVVGRALVDLKQRLFCPGKGPVCRTTITETKTGLARDRRAAHAAARSVLTTPANGNAELALHLTKAQWKALLKNHHLDLALKLVAGRGAEKVTSTLRFKLVRKR